MPTRPPIHRPHPRAPKGSPRTLPGQNLYGYQWQQTRKRFLAQHPLCVAVLENGEPCHELATDVDHVRAHRGDAELFNAWSNLQPLCHPCHARKTRAEGGRTYG